MADEIPKNTEKASPEEKSSSAAEESVSDASAAPSQLLSVTSTEMQQVVTSSSSTTLTAPSTSEGTAVLPPDVPSSSQGAEGGTLSATGARPKTKKDAGLDKAATKKGKSPSKSFTQWFATGFNKVSPIKISTKKKDSMDEQLVEYPDTGRQQKKKKSPAKPKKKTPGKDLEKWITPPPSRSSIESMPTMGSSLNDETSLFTFPSLSPEGNEPGEPEEDKEEDEPMEEDDEQKS